MQCVCVCGCVNVEYAAFFWTQPRIAWVGYIYMLFDVIYD